MTDTAISKVEDALAFLIAAYPDLSDWQIITDQSVDQALEGEDARQIQIYTTAYTQQQADEQGQTLHTATIEFACVCGDPTVGIIGRANHAAIANIIAAIDADRTLSGRLLDLQEQDVAGAAANGKSVGTASLQMTATFFTSRSNWFQIIGQGGQIF